MDSPKNGRLRSQAINLVPPRRARVQGWGQNPQAQGCRLRRTSIDCHRNQDTPEQFLVPTKTPTEVCPSPAQRVVHTSLVFSWVIFFVSSGVSITWDLIKVYNFFSCYLSIKHFFNVFMFPYFTSKLFCLHFIWFLICSCTLSTVFFFSKVLLFTLFTIPRYIFRSASFASIYWFISLSTAIRLVFGYILGILSFPWVLELYNFVSNFASRRSFFICPSILYYYLLFLYFLFDSLGGYLSLSPTSFVPACINSFIWVMYVGIYFKNLFTFSMLDLTFSSLDSHGMAM